jgi:cyclic pyranopterin phosphate synthase
MPADKFGPEHEFLAREDLLSFEEIARIARIAAGLGVVKLRLTGGEPLLRRNLAELVRQLADIPGIEDIALTTNGILLPRFAQALRDAGLHRVTVSLDGLREDIVGAMSGRGITAAVVLEGIEAAQRVGFTSVKVNMVVQRGMNDSEILPMARRFHGTGVDLRFIEYMDVGTCNGWRRAEVVPAREILAALSAEFDLIPAAPRYRGEVASRYVYANGGGEVGFITSVSQPFCGDCTRLRLSSEGKLYTCLFASRGFDVRELLRGNASDQEVGEALAGLWRWRRDRYSEERAATGGQQEKIEMHHIGG